MNLVLIFVVAPFQLREGKVLRFLPPPSPSYAKCEEEELIKSNLLFISNSSAESLSLETMATNLLINDIQGYSNLKKSPPYRK